MSRLRSWRYWLPLALGLLGLLLLFRLVVARPSILVPEDVDVVVLVVLIGSGLIAAVHTLVRMSMNHLRLRSIRLARRQTLAEHARFLNRLDHELKNPLTALHTGLKSLELTKLDQQQRQIVATLETVTLRLSRLTTDLRKLAALETQPLILRPVDIRTFILDAVQVERERFEAGQRTLTAGVDGAQETWLIDADLLALAIHNLLDNAMKYTQPGDSVHLQASAEQELTLQVSDTGAGIAPSALPHIWEELFRAPQVEPAPGSGVGLALVKAIVERHGGSVTVESEVGQGTAFSLRIPALGAEMEPPPRVHFGHQ